MRIKIYVYMNLTRFNQPKKDINLPKQTEYFQLRKIFENKLKKSYPSHYILRKPTSNPGSSKDNSATSRNPL